MRFHKKKNKTKHLAKSAKWERNAHMTRFVHLNRHDVLSVQLQAWRAPCPVGAQFGLVITSENFVIVLIISISHTSST